jgi:hypothetical protein
MADARFDGVLAGHVRKVFRERWIDLEDAQRYLALLPWWFVAVSPWAALAERAGMDASGADFIDWVTDDAAVREALAILLARGGRMDPLSVMDDPVSNWRPSTGLVAMTAAHHPGFDLPSGPLLRVNLDVCRFLESMMRDGLLTPAMADLLLKLDPLALDRLLGPEITADIDARRGLTPGTSKDVLLSVLEKADGSWQLDRLVRIVNRAEGAFPTVGVPDFSPWYGNSVPMLRAITASLVAAGVFAAAPRGRTPTELVDEVRALWFPNFDRLEQAA